MKNTTVLNANNAIAQTNNKLLRWYGLYKVQKDMYAKNQYVFSTMITSKEWDTIMNFTGYGSTKRDENTYTTEPDLSGSAYKDSNPVQYDISKNIYDLAGNIREWTLSVWNRVYRYTRGGSYIESQMDANYANWPWLSLSDRRLR